MHARYLIAAMAVAFAVQSADAVAACDDGERLVRFSHVVAAEGHPKGEAATSLAERVNREMDGALCMEVYPDSTLYEEEEALAALISGDLELAAPSTARFGTYTPRLHLFDLPFLFRNEDALAVFIEGEEGQSLLSSMEQDGLVGLQYWMAGFKQFSADRPLLVPSDAQGLTFRIQDSELSSAMIEALGAKARSIPLAGVRAALEAGEVNGQENTWSNILTQGMHRVQDGLTETNHQAFLYLVVTSRQFLDSLEPAERDQFLGILEEVSGEMNQRFAEIEAENRAAIADSGVEIRTLTEDQRAGWVEAMHPVWDRFADSIGREAIEAAQRSGH